MADGRDRPVTLLLLSNGSHTKALEEDAARLAKSHGADFHRDDGADGALGARLDAARIKTLTAENERLAADVAALRERLTALTSGHAPDIHVIDIFDTAHPAFYEPEMLAPDRTFRWMGRQDTASFATKIPGDAPVRVDVLVERTQNADVLAGILIGLDGDFAPPNEQVYKGEGAVRLSRYAPAAKGAVPRRVGVRLTTPLGPAPGDRRHIAAALSKLAVCRVSAATAERGARPRITLYASAFEGHAFASLKGAGEGATRALRPGVRASLPVALEAGRTVRIAVHLLPDADPAALAIGLGTRIARPAASKTCAEADLKVPGAPGTIVTVPVLITNEGEKALAVSRVDIFQIDPGAARDPGPFRAEVIFDEAFDDGAFYDAERDGDRPFRWMGRKERADIEVAPLPEGPLRVTVQMRVVISAAALGGLSVACDGATGHDDPDNPVRFDGPGGMTFKHFIVPARPGPAPATSILSIHAPEAKSLSEHGDPRTVSVALHKITIEHAP